MKVTPGYDRNLRKAKLSLCLTKHHTMKTYPVLNKAPHHENVINQLHEADLPEKLIITQLLRKYPAFYGTQRFITVFTGACHWSLS
jgi:hypothetical protein